MPEATQHTNCDGARVNGEANLAAAHTLWDTWAEVGLRHVCISPGSRSAPLAIAAARNPRLEKHVVVDERSSAFFGLGLAKGSGFPSALLCTSGTAVANYLPAAWEATLSQTPLLLVTADRPAELQRCGAAQTLPQSGIFGEAARACFDLPLPTPDNLEVFRAVAARAWATAIELAGPVHVNAPLREPLLPFDAHWHPPTDVSNVWLALGRHQPDSSTLARALYRKRRVMLVAGPLAKPAWLAGEWARRNAVPLLADIGSGYRFGPANPSVIWAYDALLAGGFRSEPPEFIIRFGGLPVSKNLQQWLASIDVPQAIIHDGAWPDPDHRVSLIVRGTPDAVFATLPDSLADPSLLAAWRMAQERVVDLLPTQFQSEEGSEPALAAALPCWIPDGAALFLSNSMPIRDADTFCAGGHHNVRVVVNRGANGIDGILSTALGCAVGSRRTLFAIVGDLAFLHDVSALSLVRAVSLSGIVIVVNNGGGGIFTHLDARRHADVFERYFATPLDVDVQKLCAAYGIAATTVSNRLALERAVSQAIDQPLSVVEYRTDRMKNAQLRQAIFDLLHTHLRPVDLAP